MRIVSFIFRYCKVEGVPREIIYIDLTAEKGEMSNQSLKQFPPPPTAYAGNFMSVFFASNKFPGKGIRMY